MGDNFSDSFDILFSIYPQSNNNQAINFFLQQVSRDQYYPPELRFFHEAINTSAPAYEIQRAKERFDNYIVSRKTEVLELLKLTNIREKINQRRILVLVDQYNNLVYNKDESDIVYIGGPLGGGLLQLNEELSTVKEVNYYQILTFDTENIGHPEEAVELNLEDDTYTLKTEVDLQISFYGFPVTTDEYEISPKEATRFFEDTYQRLSSITDFSPLIESGFQAAEATIRANLRYLYDLPDVAKQKFQQYNLDSINTYPNIFKLQRILNLGVNSSSIEILGYSFKSSHDYFSLVHQPLFDGLTLFMLTQCPFEAQYRFSKKLCSNSDFHLLVSDLVKRNSNMGNSSSNFVSESSLTEMVGVNVLQQEMSTYCDHLQFEEAFIGYILYDLTPDGEKPGISTNFSINQFPEEYLSVIIQIKDSLELLLTGPLEALSFRSSDIAIYLKSNDITFKIRLTTYNEYEFFMSFYLVAMTDKDLSRYQIFEPYVFRPVFNHETRKPNEMEIDDFFNYGLKQYIPADIIPEILNDLPMTKFVENKLTDHVVSVLLKRILKEVETYESNEFRTESLLDLYHSPEIVSTGQSEDNLNSKLSELEADIDSFNSGLYSFLTNMYRRISLPEMQETESRYAFLRNVYHDMTIALIDFGLTPELWKNADNLQIWTSYQAQVSYIRHAIVIELRSFLGDNYEGEDIEQLIDHKYTQSLHYKSFHGATNGGEYLNLKRIHLTFIPLIHKFRDNLGDVGTFNELIKLLEILEDERKAKIQSQLPSLPGNIN